MNKLVMISGWIFSLILIAVIFIGWNMTNHELQTRTDNFTLNYAVLDANFQKLSNDYQNLTAQSAGAQAQFNAYVTALNASYDQQNKQWAANLQNTLTAKDAQWASTLNTTLITRDAFWNTALSNALAANEVKWKTTLDATLAANNLQWQQKYVDDMTLRDNWWKAYILQVGNGQVPLPQ